MRSRLIVTAIARPLSHPIPIALSREETPRASSSPLYPHFLPFRLTAAPILSPPCCLAPRHFQPRGLRRRSERATLALADTATTGTVLSLASSRTAHNLSTTGYPSASSSRPTSSTWSAVRSKLPSPPPRATSELRPGERRGRPDVLPSSRARVPWHVGYHEQP